MCYNYLFSLSLLFDFPAHRWSPRRINTQLEDALRLVRGSPTNSSRASSARVRNQTSPTSSYYRQNSEPPGKPYFNKYAHPSVNGQSPQEKRDDLHNKSLRNLANSRNLFEQQLETYQQTLLEQQQQTLRDFNQQIMKEIEDDTHVVNGNHNGDTQLERSDSMNSLDSLEEGSNDTLRESCDLDKFMEQKKNVANGQMSRNVSFANSDRDSVRTATHSAGVTPSVYNSSPQNIDSYNAQVQAVTPAKKTEEQKQEFYLQRQKEIQQQLQDQKLQHQQDIQQKVLEQQRKQQLLLQQEYDKQYKAQQEKQRQQQEATNGQIYEAEVSKEAQRPKAQMKAWGTPSPHPPAPTPVTNTTPQNMVTHASPYSNKSTHTNMTVPTYEHVSNNNQNVVNSKPPVAPVVNSVNTYNNNNANVSQYRTKEYVPVETKQGENSTVVVQDRNLSFLETVTNDLTIKQESKIAGSIASGSTPASNLPVKVPPTTAAIVPKTTPVALSSAPTTTATSTRVNSTPASVTSAKPPVNPGVYNNSYTAAYANRQQLQQQQQQGSNGADNRSQSATTNGHTNTIRMNGATSSPWQTGGYTNGQSVMFTPDMALNGDDVADTDSVSTICEEKEPDSKGMYYTIFDARKLYIPDSCE